MIKDGEDDVTQNYVVKTAAGTLTISAMSIADAVVTLGEALTYNGTEQTQGIASVKVGDLTLTAGTDYTGWMKACWPSNNPSQPFRIWFTKLAETKNGELVPAANGCLNTISDDWNEFIFDDLKNGYVEGGERYMGYSLIFAKEPKGGTYLFRGVYREDTELSSPNHYVSKRVGTRVKLIGRPSSKIEILDDFRKK